MTTETTNTSAIIELAELARQEVRDNQWRRQFALEQSIIVFKALTSDKRSVAKIIPRAEEFCKFLTNTK